MDAIDLLPLKTYNTTPFGLQFQVNGDIQQGWTCSYYSKFVHKSDSRIPLVKGVDIDDCADQMLEWFKENMPKALKN